MSSAPSTSAPPPAAVAVPFPSTESEPETASVTPTLDDAILEPEPPKPKDPYAEVLEQAKARLEDRCTPDEDLRESVGKLITLCTRLTARISTLEPQLTELQTSLTLTQSNLTLAMANTEMLEDALKHNAHTRDVGWRRSDSTASRRPPANSVSYSTSSVTSGGSGSIDEHGARIVVHAPSPQSPPPRASTTTPTGTAQGESRFFRFRFGSKTPSPTSAIAQVNKAASPPPQVLGGAAHLTSASLPSLGLALEDVPPTPPSATSTAGSVRPADPELAALEKKLKDKEDEIKAKEESIQARDKQLEELKSKLEAEKKVSSELEMEKARVQEEIESLTQSLFEEANKMVSDERRKMAEVSALLKETEEERDAVRGAMKVVEGENGRLRELSAGIKKPDEDKEKKEEQVVKSGTDVELAVLEADGATGSDEKAEEPEKATEPEEPTPVKTESSEWVSVNGSKREPDDDAESDTDNARTSQESTRPDSATKETSPIVSPVSSDDELDEPESKDETSKPLAVAELPSLPGSSSDLWKGQARDREATPPKTPPHVHTLPVETSPWAEGRA
ncbi:hypothetical protein RSOLAG1IB_07018 [Rhizoctonia solani AG-1 IB]|uniref:GDP/GTP exchange factor Sec2 N-terminal domain-containing protein n=1 Tax=Thanatephorus cucumeris (strain AG1-IB / isolate 7/3/14) TaxID=1108050 RepID=A0A0B7FDV4_THACB|nr:hypothetical protein RSOLAG1IB_07018 [Rhizoctonia solani AG-1 IB]